VLSVERSAKTSKLEGPEARLTYLAACRHFTVRRMAMYHYMTITSDRLTKSETIG